MKPPSALKAALHSRCPQCRRGPIFTHSPLNLSKFSDTHENCPHCGLKYEPEPGFFWGAMYINYAFTVGIFLVTAGIIYIFWNPDSLFVYIAALLTILAATLPFLVRYSRVLMLYFFGTGSYNPALYTAKPVAQPPPATQQDIV